MKILDITLKDLTRSLRSYMMIGMSVVAPLLLTGLFYFAFGGMTGQSSSLPEITVGIVNQDLLPEGAPLDTSVGGSIQAMFHDESVQAWITAIDYPSTDEARLAVDQQVIGVAVIVPEGLTESVLNQTGISPVTIVHDPTLSIGPLIVRNMVESLLDGFFGGGIAWKTLNERVQANGQSLNATDGAKLLESYQTWYISFQGNLFHNPEQAALVLKNLEASAIDPIQSMISQIMAGQLIFFAFFTGAFAMQSILQEQEEGTLSRLFSTPTSRTHILAGKFLAVFLTVVLQGVVLVTFSNLVFKAQWGNIGSIALALVGQVLAAGGLGVLLVSLVKNTRQAGPIFGGGLTFLGMLSGLFTANLPNPPEIFNMIGNFTPQGWVLKAWQLSLSGNPPTDLLLPFLVLCVISTLMFTAGALIFRRRFA